MSFNRLASPRLLSLGTALSLSLATTSLASAQSLEEEQSSAAPSGTSDTASTDASAASTSPATNELTDDQVITEERVGVEHVDEFSPTERPDTDYFFFGATARGVIVPEFIQSILVQTEAGEGSGGAPLNLGVGAYFNYRRNGFNVTAEAWYLGFGTSAYYHGIGAADTEYEHIQSTMGAIFGSFLFGWSFDVTNWFAIDLGFGLGFGGFVGNLTRDEAYRDSSTRTLRTCTGPGTPDPTYCEPGVEVRDANGRIPDNQTGGTYQSLRTGDPTIDSRNGANPWYFGGGGVPPMFFWLDLPRVGVRFKPIRQIQIRIDGGYNLYGFNFGGSLGYGF